MTSDYFVALPNSCSYLGAVGSDGPRMTLILRTMKKHMGWEDAKDDYVVLDGERSVGRIYKEHGEARWFWSVNTSPYPAPPPRLSQPSISWFAHLR
jgi:hypothetical protein